MMRHREHLLLIGLLLTSFAATPQARAARLGPHLKFLLSFRDGRLPQDAPFAPRSVHAHDVRLYLEFRTPPSGATMARLEARGVVFNRLPDTGEPAHVGTIYSVRIPWSILPRVQADPAVARLEAVERRLTAPAMDLSMPAIDWSDGRYVPQDGTDGLTGRGQLIALFDTSVDVYHPALFKPDGGLFRWLDTDGDGVLTPGVDAVDLDGNGVAGEDEVLGLLENAMFDVQYGPLADGSLDTDQDWLFADTNGNGERDYGPDAGYGETDPAFGEPLFIVDDTDADGVADPTEYLVALGTSKVAGAMDGESTLTVHTRGVNLLSMAEDTYPHGTSVAGILAGDVPGRRFVGVAPEADLLVIDNEAPGVDLVYAMNWAKSKGADVMLYSFGNWIGEYLDGTSLVEQAVTEKADNGIPQVCPAGNIGLNNKHGYAVSPPDGDALAIFFVDQTFNVSTVYLTALWREEQPELTFEVEFISSNGISPNSPVIVVEDSVETNGEGDFVSAIRSTSSTGTNMMDMTLYHQEGDDTELLYEGLYTVRIANAGISTAKLHLFLGDDRTTWTGGATWITSEGTSPGAVADPSYSVTSPATADKCIVVGSYATRQQEVLGNLSTFSSRGPRIDQEPLLDITAPGNYDVWAPASAAATYFDASINAWPNYPYASSWLFSGTSAAAPHVAGTAALLRQIDENFTHDDIETAIRNGAIADGFTGEVPNASWGMGKLDVGGAIQAVDDVPPEFSVLVDRHPILANYLMVTIVPSERLAGPPQLESTTESAGEVISAGNDIYFSTFPAPDNGSSVALSVTGVDLAGNTGVVSRSYTF